jgi:hypothetical protein
MPVTLQMPTHKYFKKAQKMFQVSFSTYKMNSRKVRKNCKHKIRKSNIVLYYLVLAMSTGIEATVVMKADIILLTKKQKMFSSK